ILGASFLVLPGLPKEWNPNAFGEFGIWELSAMMASELCLGITIAVMSRIMMETVVLGGHLMDRDMGFAMASIMDPGAEGQRTVISLIFLNVLLLIFVIIDAHHDFLRIALISFDTIGPGEFVMNDTVNNTIIDFTANMFLVGFKISLPIFCVILIINIGMAFMAKFGQEFEVMMLSFPVRLGLGLFTVVMLLPIIIQVFTSLIDDFLFNLLELLT
ncbi:MAG: flagellar biosynthetic protein FliR, partial [Lentisphaeria bacterium]|nr:flagellar biosynthetic protein FliR [Lentisphaeria bacterium]NQZ69436.1 flagellar biosynthetic protein FliR [Lentisphaeria bacterium]